MITHEEKTFNGTDAPPDDAADPIWWPELRDVVRQNGPMTAERFHELSGYPIEDVRAGFEAYAARGLLVRDGGGVYDLPARERHQGGSATPTGGGDAAGAETPEPGGTNTDPPPSGTDATAEVADAWGASAVALARWAMMREVNRDDRCGWHFAEDGTFGRRTIPKEGPKPGYVTLQKLARHFRGQDTKHIIGLHAIGPDNTGKWAGSDIDAHDGQPCDPRRNEEFATGRYSELVGLGFRPLLFDSDGKGGFHLKVYFEDAIPSRLLFSFATWMGRGGEFAKVECFPRQPELNEATRWGNWMRLIGRHYKREHWARAWDGQQWLEGDAAVRLVLSLTGDSPALIPLDAYPAPPEEGTPNNGFAGHYRTNGTAHAEGGLPGHAFDDLADWPKLLRDDGAKLLRDRGNGVTEWVRPGKKGEVGATLGFKKDYRGTPKLHVFTTNWPGLKDNEAYTPLQFVTQKKYGAVNPETLSRMVRDLLRQGVVKGSVRPSARFSGGTGGTDEAEPGAAPGGNGDSATSDDPEPMPRGWLSNFKEEEIQSEGTDKPKKARVGLHSSAIARDLFEQTGGWPRRVAGRLFARGDDHRPQWLDKPAEVFAYIATAIGERDDQTNSVAWAEKGTRMVTKAEFVAHLEQCATSYDAVEAYPHFPAMPKHYYIHPPVTGGDGKALAGFLGKFNPSTEVDKDLALACLLTLVWGGPAGARPAFLFSAAEGDSKGGRGVGKSTMAKFFSQLVGGSVRMRERDEFGKLLTRLLSPEAATNRVLMLDNLKTRGFSWGDLEDLITSPEISGHRLFQGEGKRPNTLTPLITMNGPKLGKDMAQRSVEIRLGRPVYSATWEKDVAQYVEDERWNIIGDLAAVLLGPKKQLAQHDRRGTWEGEVLSCVGDPAACQKVIKERQLVADADEEEKDIVRGEFRRVLRAMCINPDEVPVRFNSTATRIIVSRALGEPFTSGTATSKLYELKEQGLKEVRKADLKGERYWGWWPENCEREHYERLIGYDERERSFVRESL